MINSKRYWYILLQHFEQKGYFENGLTIPFIIGSRAIIEPEQPLQSIEELIEDIRSAPGFVSVLDCGQIGAHVFRLTDKSEFNIYGGIENITITDSSFHDANSISDVITDLNKLYAKHISSGSYSRKGGEWVAYDELDLPRLRETCLVFKN